MEARAPEAKIAVSGESVTYLHVAGVFIEVLQPHIALTKCILKSTS